MSPEEVVETYLKIAFNMEEISQKNLLLELTTDTLKEALASASDETIRTAYLDNRYELLQYSFGESKVLSEDTLELSLHLNYSERPEGYSDETGKVNIETENTIVCVKENNLWLIKDISGSRTSFDFPLTPWSTMKP